MTIRNRYLNDRLGNVERCAEEAPAGTYEGAKRVVAAIHSLSNSTLATMRAHGLNAGNDDRLRNLEVALFQYVLESNGDGHLATAEGFGAAMDGPAAERVKKQAARDRDALAAIRERK